MSKEEDEAEKTALSFLKSQRMNQLADYVSRGRAFGKMTDEEVHEGWRASMGAMARSPTERAHRRLNNDYESELDLRRLPFPEGTEEAKQFLDASKRMIDELLADPEERERIRADLAKDLGDFIDQRNRRN
jgi:hypothetical protein